MKAPPTPRWRYSNYKKYGHGNDQITLSRESQDDKEWNPLKSSKKHKKLGELAINAKNKNMRMTPWKTKYRNREYVFQ